MGKCVRNGVAFHSEFEGSFYAPFIALEFTNKITELALQDSVKMFINGTTVGRYTWDYSFKKDGIKYYIECKGYMYARDIFRFKVAKAYTENSKTKVLIVWQKPKTKKQIADNEEFYKIVQC